MRIGVDIDGVLTDVQKWILDVGGKYFERFNKHIVDANAYSLAQIFDINEQLCKSFWDEKLFDYLAFVPAREKASEVMKKLKDDGHELVIISARSEREFATSDGHRLSHDITREWLCRNGICYDKLIFTQENKSKYCKINNIDIMIEDNADNLIDISKLIPVICYDCEYNKDVQSDYRAYNWIEIYEYIEKMKEKGEK